MKVELSGGEVVDLGTTETGLTLAITDYSRRVTDDFGVTTVVERGFARRLSTRLSLAFDAVDALQRRLADLRATPATWIADDRFSSLAVEGFYKEFSLDLAVPPLSYCTLTVEGLTEAAPAADPGGDPAPDGKVSTLRLLQPVTITSAVLTATNVPETDYPEWSAGTTYAAGARVIRATTHRVYESTVAANLGNDPAAGAGKWVDVGPTNRWAMFDQALGTATARAGSIELTLAPGVVNALALLDVEATTVRAQASGYDRTIAVDAGPVLFLDLPGSGGAVTVTITGPGTVSVGTLLIGRLVALGITEAAPSAGITDYSRKEVDDFGEATIVERAWAERMTARAIVRTDAIDAVVSRVAAVRARPSLWIGDSALDSLTVYGFFKEFSVEVGETVSTIALSVEGLSKATPLADPAPPTFSWAGDWANDRSYQRNEIVRHDGRLFGSKVHFILNHQPPSSAADDDYWFFFVDKGSNGTPGAPGANGRRPTSTSPMPTRRTARAAFPRRTRPESFTSAFIPTSRKRTRPTQRCTAGRRSRARTGCKEPPGVPDHPDERPIHLRPLRLRRQRRWAGELHDRRGRWPDLCRRLYRRCEADSTNPATYSWSRQRAWTGRTALPALRGERPDPLFHVAYANSASGVVGLPPLSTRRAHLHRRLYRLHPRRQP
jgi:hypothetical protein